MSLKANGILPTEDQVTWLNQKIAQLREQRNKARENMYQLENDLRQAHRTIHGLSNNIDKCQDNVNQLTHQLKISKAENEEQSVKIEELEEIIVRQKRTIKVQSDKISETREVVPRRAGQDARAAIFDRPPPVYNQPQLGFNQASMTYNAPPPAYKQSHPVHDQPQPVHNQRYPAYNQPHPAHNHTQPPPNFLRPGATDASPPKPQAVVPFRPQSRQLHSRSADVFTTPPRGVVSPSPFRTHASAPPSTMTQGTMEVYRPSYVSAPQSAMCNNLCTSLEKGMNEKTPRPANGVIDKWMDEKTARPANGIMENRMDEKTPRPANGVMDKWVDQKPARPANGIMENWLDKKAARPANGIMEKCMNEKTARPANGDMAETMGALTIQDQYGFDEIPWPAEFGQFFKLTEDWARNYANVPNEYQDKNLPNDLLASMKRQTSEDLVMKLLGCSATRYFLVARLMNTWISNDIFRGQCFLHYSPDFDQKLHQSRQAPHNDPIYTRASLLTAVAESAREMRARPDFQQFYTSLVTMKVDGVWERLLPLLAPGIINEQALGDMVHLIREALRMGLLMMATPLAYSIEFPRASPTTYFRPDAMINRDPVLQEDPQQLFHEGTIVRLGITPVVVVTCFAGPSINPRTVHFANVLLQREPKRLDQLMSMASSHLIRN